jgi:peptide deformylase
MAKRPIILLPDPILRETALPMERVDDTARRLLDDMLATMYDAPGVGLAAPQIGVSRRVVVIDPSPKDSEPEPLSLINPEILAFGDERRLSEEGCLSIPEIFAEVERPAWVEVRYIDRNGKLVERRFEGRPAVIVQHEVDHLNGVLFIDHLSKLRRDLLIRKFRKARRDDDGD